MKRDKNIIIGILCGILVLMGAGYAFFTAQLNIASTGTIKGNFKVVMTEVTPTAVCPSNVSQITSACGTADGTLNSGVFVYNPGVTTVTLDTSLMKPNDVVVYTIKVENQGNIAARYKEINSYASDAHVEIETDIDDATNAPIDIIQPGGSDTFTVTVRLKDLNNTEFNASKAPTTHSWTLSPVFEQVTSGETPTPQPTPGDDEDTNAITWYTGTYQGSSYAVGFDENMTLVSFLRDENFQSINGIQLVLFDSNTQYVSNVTDVEPQNGDYISTTEGGNIGILLRNGTLYMDGYSLTENPNYEPPVWYYDETNDAAVLISYDYKLLYAIISASRQVDPSMNFQFVEYESDSQFGSNLVGVTPTTGDYIFVNEQNLLLGIKRGDEGYMTLNGTTIYHLTPDPTGSYAKYTS